MVSLSVQLSEMHACMNGLKLIAFLSIADMTQVESPIVETVATASGKTCGTLYCSLVVSTNVDNFQPRNSESRFQRSDSGFGSDDMRDKLVDVR